MSDVIFMVRQGVLSLLLAVVRLLLPFQQSAVHHFHSVYLSELQQPFQRPLSKFLQDKTMSQ